MLRERQKAAKRTGATLHKDLAGPRLRIKAACLVLPGAPFTLVFYPWVEGRYDKWGLIVIDRPRRRRET